MHQILPPTLFHVIIYNTYHDTVHIILSNLHCQHKRRQCRREYSNKSSGFAVAIVRRRCGTIFRRTQHCKVKNVLLKLYIEFLVKYQVEIRSNAFKRRFSSKLKRYNKFSTNNHAFKRVLRNNKTTEF